MPHFDGLCDINQNRLAFLGVLTIGVVVVVNFMELELFCSRVLRGRKKKIVPSPLYALHSALNPSH